jgi:hypothetical protein
MNAIAAGKPVRSGIGAKLEMRRLFEWGGFAAAAILVAFGIAAIVMGFNGRSTVGSSLKAEKIVGSSDMTPTAIAAEAKGAGLTGISLPTCSVAGKTIDTGNEARCFAQYMRIHTLESSAGATYAQMGRFQALPDAPKAQLAVGGGTDNTKYAVTDPQTHQPVANGARNLWVTETALTTALNTSYMADQLGLFGIVVGVALLLSGVGFAVLAFAALHRKRQEAKLA